jgi:hypothetical protein
MRAPYYVCVCAFVHLSTFYTIVLQLLHSLYSYFGRILSKIHDLFLQQSCVQREEIGYEREFRSWLDYESQGTTYLTL